MQLSYEQLSVFQRSYDPRPAGQVIDLIVLHHGGGTEESDLAILTGKTPVPVGRQWVYLSAHYYIGEKKSYALVPEDMRARHAGGGEGVWAQPDPNSRSVGIETKNFGTAVDAWEDVQLARILLCVRDVQRRHQIAADHIVGHKHIAPSRKKDPAGLPWDEQEWPSFRQLVLLDPQPILGEADLSADRFGQLLVDLKSPFAREAPRVYEAIVEAGIRPAIALAFHAHEGGDMTGVVGKQLNWAAVRTPADPALASGSANGFAVYDDPVKSVRDWCKRLTGPKYLGADLDTVEQVVLRYAPFSDGNSPWRYAVTVHRLVSRWTAAAVATLDMAPIFQATGQAVAPVLLAFWQDLGGVGKMGARGQWVPGIGMPVSALGDAPDGNGVVQWFERGVLGIDSNQQPRWLLLSEVRDWPRP